MTGELGPSGTAANVPVNSRPSERHFLVVLAEQFGFKCRPLHKKKWGLESATPVPKGLEQTLL